MEHIDEEKLRLVIVESPYAAEDVVKIWENIKYARRCVRHSLLHGEAPIASHILYTQPGILDDKIPEERQWGIDAGLAWREVAEASCVYVDRGISSGMKYGIRAARQAGIPVEFRALDLLAAEIQEIVDGFESSENQSSSAT